MAQPIDFNKLIEEISSDNSGSFILKKDSAFIYSPVNDTQPLAYINSAPTNWYEKFKNAIDSAVSRGGRVFTDFQEDVRRAFSSDPSAAEDLASNNQINKIVQNQDSGLLEVSLNVDAPAILLQSGLGKRLEWSKIRIFDGSPRNTAGVNAFCRTEDLQLTANAKKSLIGYPYGQLLLGGAREDKLYPKTLDPTSNLSFNTKLNESAYDDRLAAYYISIDTGLFNYENLELEKIKAVLKRSFKLAIKKILSSNQRSQQTADSADYEDRYYCFAKIENYFLSPRNGQGLVISVSLPYRNMVAVTSNEAGFADTVTQTTQNIINNAASAIQAVNDAAANYSIDITKNLGAANQILDGVNSLGGTEVGSYIDPTKSAKLSNRTVIFKNDETEFVDKFDKLISVLKVYDDVMIKYLNDDKNVDAKFYIDLGLYAEGIRNCKNKILKFLFPLGPPLNRNNVYFQFKDGYLTDITYDENEQVPEIRTILDYDPFTDITLCIFLSNINDIISLKTQDPQVNALLEFLNNYVYPEEYAKATLANPQEQTNLGCFKDNATLLKEQALARTDESLRKTKFLESKNNLLKSADFVTGGAEYQNTKKDIELKITEDIARFREIKTINWGQMTVVATSCIADKETRELALAALEAVRKSLQTGTPILCNIPRINLPTFPYIALPQVPSLGSIVTSFYNKVSGDAYSSRNDLVKSIIQGILDLVEACEVPKDLDKEGSEKAEDLFGSISQPSQNLPPEDVREQRKNDFLNAGLFGTVEEAELKTDEVRLFLEEISAVLTPNELIKAFNGIIEESQYQSIKAVIERLNYENKIPNIYSDISTRIKLINFLQKLGTLISPDVYDRFGEQEPYNTANGANFLCDNQTPFETILANKYLNKGLTPEQTRNELENRRANQLKVINNFTNIANLLEKDKVEVQGTSCSRDVNGNKTPGSAQKYGIPEPFEKLKKDLMFNVFRPFEQAFNEEITEWYANNSEITSSTKDDISYKSTIFLKYMNDKNFYPDDIIWRTNVFIKDYTTKTDSYLPSYKLGEVNNIQNMDEALLKIIELGSTTNFVDITGSVGYTVNGNNVVSSSVSASIDTRSSLTKDNRTTISFNSSDKTLLEIYNLQNFINEYNIAYQEIQNNLYDSYRLSYNNLLIELEQLTRKIKQFLRIDPGPERQGNIDQAALLQDAEKTLRLLISVTTAPTEASIKLEDLIKEIKARQANIQELDEKLLSLQNNTIKIGEKVYNQIKIVEDVLSKYKNNNSLTENEAFIRNNDNSINEGYTKLLDNIKSMPTDKNYRLSNPSDPSSALVLDINVAYTNFSGFALSLILIKRENENNTEITVNTIDLSSLKDSDAVNIKYQNSSSMFSLLEDVSLKLTADEKKKISSYAINNLVDSFQKSPLIAELTTTANVAGISLFSPDKIVDKTTACNKLNFSLEYTRNDLECNLPDERLINIITNMKSDILEAALDPCYVPSITSDGRVENSPTSTAYYMSVYNVFLRLFAIEYNLKLIAFLQYLPYLNLDIFFIACYALFTNFLNRKYGPTFLDEMYSSLAIDYIRKNRLDIDKELIYKDEEYRKKIFIFYFKDKHFTITANNINKLLTKEINYTYAAPYNREQKRIKIHEEKLKHIKTVPDYEFFRNIDSYLYGTPNNLISNIRVVLEKKDGSILPLAPEGLTVEALNLQPNELFLITISNLLPKIAKYRSLYEEYIPKKKWFDSLNPALNIGPDSLYAKNETEVEQYKKDLEKLYLEIGISTSSDGSILAKNVEPYLNNLSNGRINNLPGYYSQLLSYIEFSKRSYNALTGQYGSDLKVFREKIIESKYGQYESYKTIIENILNVNNFIRQQEDKYYVIGNIITSSSADFEYYKEEITEQAAKNFITDKVYLPNFTKMLKIYNDIFTYIVSLEGIYQNLISAYLLSVESLHKSDDSFSNSMSKLKNVLDVVKASDDYRYEPETDGVNIAKMVLKTSAKFAVQATKAAAAASDLNVGISNNISKLYSAGVIAAKQAGVNIPVKHIPIFVHSAGLWALGVPPVGALAYTAIGASVTETIWSFGGDELLEQIMNKDNKKC